MTLLVSQSLLFVIGLSVLHMTSGSNYGGSAQPFRCYDCDYDQQTDDVQQAGQVQGQGQYGMSPVTSNVTSGNTVSDTYVLQPTIAGRRGFSRCALDSATNDHQYVRETHCKHGICFIRKDFNGLIYRGCADPSKLPLDINTNVQCQAQGQRPAVWWFCNGTLCNSGRFSGSSGVCGNEPASGASGIGNFVNQTTVSSPSLVNPNAAAGMYPTTRTGTTSSPPIGSSTSGMTFDQVQQNLGYGGQTPTFYGGTGLSSEQSFQQYSGVSSGQRPTNNVSMMTSSYQSPPTMKMTMLGNAPNLVYQSPQPVGPIQPSTMTGQSVSYQGQQSQQVIPQPVVAYNALNVSQMVGTARPTGVTSEQQVQSQHVPYFDNRRPDVAAPVQPSGSNQTMPAAGTYKTWDFVVMAQSRLHRLQDQTDNNDRGQNEATENPQADIVVQPFTGAQSTSTGSRENYVSIETVGNAPVYNPAASTPSNKTTYYTTVGQPSAVSVGVSAAQNGSQSQFGGIKDIQGQTTDLSGFSGCDGQCRDNPSALFVDPSHRNAFIQCGPGMDFATGVACQCCRPQRMLCPESTTFDDVTKVCTSSANGVPAVDNKQTKSWSAAY